ncbi:acetylcholine receptor subunit alpha-like 1, partial [Caerostris darwini]
AHKRGVAPQWNWCHGYPPFTVKTRCEPTEGASDNQDIFLCSIKLGSWTYDVSRLRIQERNQNILQAIGPDTFRDSNRKWKLESMTARSEQKKPKCCKRHVDVTRNQIIHKTKSEDLSIITTLK